MQTHYVFVDYDNTHLGNVSLLGRSPQKFKIKIYLGAHHNVIPLALARALQPLGEDAEYIQFDGRHNTIECNIAFQLGQLAIQHPQDQYSILTNDPGFNEIVAGLKAKGISCKRFSDMESFIKSVVESATPKEGAPADKIVDIMDPRKRTQDLTKTQ